MKIWFIEIHLSDSSYKWGSYSMTGMMEAVVKFLANIIYFW